MAKQTEFDEDEAQTEMLVNIGQSLIMDDMVCVVMAFLMTEATSKLSEGTTDDQLGELEVDQDTFTAAVRSAFTDLISQVNETIDQSYSMNDQSDLS